LFLTKPFSSIHGSANVTSGLLYFQELFIKIKIKKFYQPPINFTSQLKTQTHWKHKTLKLKNKRDEQHREIIIHLAQK